MYIYIYTSYIIYIYIMYSTKKETNIAIKSSTNANYQSKNDEKSSFHSKFKFFLKTVIPSLQKYLYIKLKTL